MAETMHMDIKAIFNVYMLVLCYMIYLVPKICTIISLIYRSKWYVFWHIYHHMLVKGLEMMF